MKAWTLFRARGVRAAHPTCASSRLLAPLNRARGVWAAAPLTGLFGVRRLLKSRKSWWLTRCSSCTGGPQHPGIPERMSGRVSPPGQSQVYTTRSLDPVLVESIVVFIDSLGSQAVARDRTLQQRRLEQLSTGIAAARKTAGPPQCRRLLLHGNIHRQHRDRLSNRQTGDPR